MRLLSYVVALLFWLAGGFSSLQASSIPSFDTVKQQHQSSDKTIVDRQGQLLQLTRVDWQRRQGDWLELKAVSPALLQVLLYAEDRRFYEHAGIDWYAVAGTVWSSLWGQRLRGTSTVSMQLVDLLHLGSGRARGPRSWPAKWEQAQLARQLEAQWTKAEILEAYLNLVPFKGELVGVDAMARVLWQKQAFALSLPEAALAVAMLPSPNASTAVLQQRSCALWRGIQVKANCQSQQWANQRALSRVSQPAWGNPAYAPHFSQWLLNQSTTNEAVFASSLDLTLQRQGQIVLQQHLSDLQRQNVSDAALLVLDNQTGQVLAYIGGSSHSTAAQFDHIQAKRQAGSTLKPFLYQLALAQQRITAASLLADTSTQFATPYGLYVPQNYDEQFMGWVSARVALAGSINIPAVRLLAQVGVDEFQRYLQNMDFSLPHSADYYGLGLALGGAETSLWQLTNAYRSLANLGQYGPACWHKDCQSEASRVAPAPETWITQHILSDNTARSVTFGLDSALNTPFWTAVKTGTSKDMRDNWAVGFSQHYTVGAWVGNTDGSAMHEVSGVSGAAPIWHDIMQFLHQHRGSRALPQPTQVVCQAICFVNHNEASRQECFIQGTQQAEIRLQTMAVVTNRIVSPLDQAIYALDPDIPLKQQQLKMQAAVMADTPVIWRINGQPLSDQTTFYWVLQPGRHQIELLHGKNLKRLDAIYVDIRG